MSTEAFLNHPNDTKKRIVLAAIGILESDGAAGITVRRIAGKAGVNTAAVNYHFGSKANLMDFVLKSTMGHAFDDWVHVARTDGLGPGAMLYCLLSLVMEGVSRFPGLVETHLFDPAVRREARLSFSREFDGFIDLLTDTLDERIQVREGTLRLCLAQLLTAAIAGALFPELLTAAFKGDREPDRDAYIRNLIQRFTGILPSPSPDEAAMITELRSMAFGGSGIRGIP